MIKINFLILFTFKGKTESIWDRVAHTKQELFADDTNSPSDNMMSEKKCLYVSKGIPMYRPKYKPNCAAITGDITCNSYYKVDEDVKLLKELKVSVSSIFNNN